MIPVDPSAGPRYRICGIATSTVEKVKLANQAVVLLTSLVERVQNAYEIGMVNQNALLKVQVEYNY